MYQALIQPHFDYTAGSVWDGFGETLSTFNFNLRHNVFSFSVSSDVMHELIVRPTTMGLYRSYIRRKIRVSNFPLDELACVADGQPVTGLLA